MDDEPEIGPQVTVIGGSVPAWVSRDNIDRCSNIEIMILKGLSESGGDVPKVSAPPDAPTFRWLFKDTTVLLSTDQVIGLNAAILFDVSANDLDIVTEAWSGLLGMPQRLIIGLDAGDVHKMAGVRSGHLCHCQPIVMTDLLAR